MNIDTILYRWMDAYQRHHYLVTHIDRSSDHRLINLLHAEVATLCDTDHISDNAGAAQQILSNLEYLLLIVQYRQIKFNYGRLVEHLFIHHRNAAKYVLLSCPDHSITQRHLVQLIECQEEDILLWLLPKITLTDWRLVSYAISHRLFKVVAYLADMPIINRIWMSDRCHHSVYLALQVFPEVVPVLLRSPCIQLQPDRYLTQSIYRRSPVNILTYILEDIRITSNLIEDDLNRAIMKAESLHLHEHVSVLESFKFRSDTSPRVDW